MSDVTTIHDVVITGGTVLDGTGAEAVRADVAVDGDRITAIGDLGDATGRSTIDAAGLVVTPASSTSTPTSTPRSRGTRA